MDSVRERPHDDGALHSRYPAPARGRGAPPARARRAGATDDCVVTYDLEGIAKSPVAKSPAGGATQGGAR
ncbi:hypothetical protein WME97_37695 [Sorangium sp. So ce367]|uniref:hypothetical protein n=1 Tax=Sorangium sp. So ce367 TaxID=3133305 RepID=UPI003F608D5E